MSNVQIRCFNFESIRRGGELILTFLYPYLYAYVCIRVYISMYAKVYVHKLFIFVEYILQETGIN